MPSRPASRYCMGRAWVLHGTMYAHCSLVRHPALPCSALPCAGQLRHWDTERPPTSAGPQALRAGRLPLPLDVQVDPAQRPSARELYTTLVACPPSPGAAAPSLPSSTAESFAAARGSSKLSWRSSGSGSSSGAGRAAEPGPPGAEDADAPPPPPAAKRSLRFNVFGRSWRGSFLVRGSADQTAGAAVPEVAAAGENGRQGMAGAEVAEGGPAATLAPGLGCGAGRAANGGGGGPATPQLVDVEPQAPQPEQLP